MMINDNDWAAYYEYISLSSDCLRTFVGNRIVNMIRYSWWPKGDVSAECDVEAQQAFSLTAGPLLIIFEDGRRLCVASDPSSNSVLVWLEANPGDVYSGVVPEFSGRLLEDDPELFPIPANDGKYAAPFWADICGARLAKLTIIKQRAEFLNAKEAARPSERGLCFILEDGTRFIASHGLHDESDDFSVIEERNVHSSFIPQLEEIDL
ncbi:hypothetical protein [Lysobacter capsici]|uniref:hypothetical protein n=1 Tax=Lysobacter capsici TaxID=435897 RepID=UPI00287BA9D0|nr:hypothetical protein [Lysobacter capsici]WND79849.1 hypothetical protein RJ610_21595 [Lysobacter capsici]WND85045.1 hypothetical protein RJ609_21610 [Lysobacter capsici]